MKKQIIGNFTKLEEKASIDWNNYLTSEEVKQFLQKDDKNEAAEEIIYSKEFIPRYKDFHNDLQAKYKNSWTKKELVQDLVSFYNFGHLITESKETSKEQYINEINNIVNKCKKYNILDKLRYYTVPYMRDYQLKFNPTADSRKNPWKFLLDEINSTLQDNLEDDTELFEFVDSFITEGNKCIEENIKTENYNICNNVSNKKKLNEATRNELLAKAKKQTITRYDKSAGYKGFSIVDIDTTSVFTTNSLRVTCRVGNYFDTVEMQNILYWVQIEAEKNPNYQINTKGVTNAIMNSIDGMDIKVDCTCGDFKYRFAYEATKFKYKYGKPENRPAKIRNPNDYGSMCKHLISMLSNKKWLQKVTGTLMDFLVKRIDDVNRFLKPKKGEELTLPNELARQNAKKAYYTKLFDKDTDEDEEELEDIDTEQEDTSNEENNEEKEVK